MILEMVEEYLQGRVRIAKATNELSDNFIDRLMVIFDDETMVYLIEMCGFYIYQAMQFIGR